MQSLYGDNFKALLKYIKRDLNTWSNKSCHWIKSISKNNSYKINVQMQFNFNQDPNCNESLLANYKFYFKLQNDKHSKNIPKEQQQK